MVPEDDCYSIGKVAGLCNTPVKTLRYYDEIGLLKPTYRREESNYRYYSKEQMNTLLVIRRLRALGFNLKEVQSLIEDTSLDFIESMMTAKQAELNEEIRMLQAKQQTISSLLGRVRLGRAIMAQHRSEVGPDLSRHSTPIQVEYIPEGQLLYSRQLMKQYRNADVSFSRWIDILEQCTALGIPLESPIIVTFYGELLGQFLMKDCDVEFGVLIGQNAVSPEIENVRSWGGTYAATVYHVGKYSDIVRSYITLLQWINQHGCEVLGPPAERFIISPLEVKDEGQHIVQILIPIRRPAA